MCRVTFWSMFYRKTYQEVFLCIEFYHMHVFLIWTWSFHRSNILLDKSSSWSSYFRWILLNKRNAFISPLKERTLICVKQYHIQASFSFLRNSLRHSHVSKIYHILIYHQLKSISCIYYKSQVSHSAERLKVKYPWKVYFQSWEKCYRRWGWTLMVTCSPARSIK